MPRTIRFEFPGSIAHIMSRGLDGIGIFTEDDERYEFLYRLKKYLRSTGYLCYAWALMDNHYHLLLRTNENPMSKVMRGLNGGYARWFNKRHGRRGYLLQDRFKSILCQDTEYAKQLIRYIHLNPLRSGKVNSLDKLKYWKWCGHGYLIGTPGALGEGFQERKEVLRRFGTDIKQAVQNYMDYLQNGIDPSSFDTAGRLSDEAIIHLEKSVKGLPVVIGNHEYLQKAMKKNADRMRKIHMIKNYREMLKKTAETICKEFNITYKELFLRGRMSNRSKARCKFCYISHCEKMIPLVQIAHFLNINSNAVLHMVRKMNKM
ncbi:MAG: hypothetical protein GF350_02270 [Chitinivibrionales bacterium]|nr:hypothetical protein [Chitinivibrionales bacterium]